MTPKTKINAAYILVNQHGHPLGNAIFYNKYDALTAEENAKKINKKIEAINITIFSRERYIKKPKPDHDKKIKITIE